MEIYIDNGEFIFPEKEWSDFIVITLNWWSDSLLRLMNNASKSESFDFMDGPLLFKINYTRENEFDIYFLRKDIVMHKATISGESFCKYFIKEMNSLLRYLNKEDWHDEEVEKLKINYNRLLSTYRDFSCNN